MSEVVEEHPSLIPVINRFGIRLGLGDKSVKTICDEYQLDTDFLLTVINTFLNEEYFPERKLQTFHTTQIIDYLTKTNLYYLRYQLPNIERHLTSFISMSTPGNNTLNLIGKFFSSFKEERKTSSFASSVFSFPAAAVSPAVCFPEEVTSLSSFAVVFFSFSAILSATWAFASS